MRCRKCGEDKPEIEFPFDLRFKAPRRAKRCSRCSGTRASRRWQQRNPEKAKLGAYLSRFKIDFEAVWGEQGGLCVVCGEALLREGMEPLSVCVDHDRSCCPGQRSCGQCLRGLVHRRCNLVLGYSKDDPDVLRGLISYLERWGSRETL